MGVAEGIATVASKLTSSYEEEDMASVRYFRPYPISLREVEWLYPGKSIDTYWLWGQRAPIWAAFTITV
jgi:hypothetical protein